MNNPHSISIRNYVNDTDGTAPLVENEAKCMFYIHEANVSHGWYHVECLSNIVISFGNQNHA